MCLIFKEDNMFEKPEPRFLTFVFSLTIILTLALSACGPTGTPIPSITSNTDKGGVWIDDLANEPDSFIPNASVQTFTAIVMQGLYAPLFIGTSSGTIEPGLATEIPTVKNGGISPDSKTWIFHLRPNLVWSDGQPLNANDVDFTWKVWGNPNFAAARTAIYKHILSADVSPDKLTITFHLKDSFAAFLPGWIDGESAPLPKHHFENMPLDQIKRSPDHLLPTVTSGPFMMSESKPGDHYTLVRNPKYYLASQGLPYLDKIIFRPVTNEETVLKDLQSGSIDSAWFLDSAKLPSYKQLNDYNLVQTTSSGYEALHFNQNNPALKDVNVRKAIALAINTPQLIKTARLGAAIPLCTDHTQAYTPGYQPGIKCPTFDLNAANALLDNAGWMMGSDGVRKKGNVRLEFQYSSTANVTWREQVEAINQANFLKIGVKIDIRNYPASTFFGSFLPGGKAGSYDLAEWSSSYNYDPDDATLLECDQVGKSNFNWYCNPQMDALLLKEEQIADPTQRQQIFNQIHQMILTDIPFATMFSANDLSIHKKGANNYMPGPFISSETANIMNWWCNNGKCPSQQ
jgi:peptide/nickel transport system substrate-binding protein